MMVIFFETTTISMGQKVRTIQMGAIIIKWANNDKGLNHKWALFEHFDLFIEKIFRRMFLQDVLENIESFPNKLHYLC